MLRKVRALLGRLDPRFLTRPFPPPTEGKDAQWAAHLSHSNSTPASLRSPGEGQSRCPSVQPSVWPSQSAPWVPRGPDQTQSAARSPGFFLAGQGPSRALTGNCKATWHSGKNSRALTDLSSNTNPTANHPNHCGDVTSFP